MTGRVLFGVGAIVCLLNCSLSWLRYPQHRLRGGAPENYRWVSGFPVVGSVLVAMAWLLWLRGEGSRPLDVTAGLLVLIDTGGIHWFLLVMFTHWARSRGRSTG
jgi:hypothetical protein